MEDLDASAPVSQIDWEAFYANFRKPDYIRGYEILQKLGAGAFGLVFKARKHSIGKDYAIKFLKVDDATVRDAVLHELDTVRLFAQIDHPNLVSIEDMGHVSGIPFIVMGYAGEETLARRLQAGRIARDDALRIFAQVARGVHALHERMLVHFDLKPANVYLKGDAARVGDYGLSKLVTASRRSLSFGRGTTYYMAPEVMHRKGDHRSDIYSLGVILYECLVGRVPFQGETEWEILKKHETEAPAYPEGMLASDRAVLEACLAKDPEDRVQGIPQILDALQGSAPPPARRTRASGTVFDPTPPKSSGTPPSGHRSPYRFLVVTVGVLLLAMVPIWFTAPGQPRALPSPSAPTRLVAPIAPLPRGLVVNSGSAEAVAIGPVAIAGNATDDGPEVAEFHDRLDAAIEALRRLREVDVRMPEVRTKAMSALGATLQNLDLKTFRGQDPWTETLLRALKAGLEHEAVRAKWSEVLQSLLAPRRDESRPR